MNRRAAGLAGSLMLLGAFASGLAPASAPASAGESCTIDGCTSAAPPSGRLGAVLLDDAARQAIGQAVRAAPAAAPASASALMSSSKQATGASGDAWDRHLGRDPGREAYNCVLGVGIGGALARDGFVGTRALGRTQVWRDGQKP